MKKYGRLIPIEELRLLENLIHKQVYLLLFPFLHFTLGSQVYENMGPVSFVLNKTVDPHYYIIMNTWAEAESLEDYGNLSVSKQKYPARIDYEDSRVGPVISGNHASIDLFATISTIEVYTIDHTQDDEHFLYDHALVFNFEERDPLAIAVGPGAAVDPIEVTDHKERIEEMIADCHLRRLLQA